MLNEEALQAAKEAHALCRFSKPRSQLGGLRLAANTTETLAAIEAYLAALPDEDGLVREIREEAEEQEVGCVGDGSLTADILRRAADALEAARAAAPEISDG